MLTKGGRSFERLHRVTLRNFWVHGPRADATSTQTNVNVDSREIGHFSSMAKEWWDPKGEFGPIKHAHETPLHAMNPCRVNFIRSRLVQQLSRDQDDPHPLQGLSVLDVGCGGGLLSESLCRLGGNVTGIDESFESIQMAQVHMKVDSCLQHLQYRHIGTGKLLEEGAQFDVVCSLEVVEHVPEPHPFVQTLLQLVKPGGNLFLSTMNRTPLSFLVAILGAEYVLRLIKPGTHTWQKFLTPAELQHFLSTPCASLNVSSPATQLPQAADMEVNGLVMDPFSGEWRLRPDFTLVNYILWCRKPMN